MADTPETPAAVAPGTNWMLVTKVAAVGLVGAAFLALELTGHADKGTFQQFGWAVLGLVGIHTTAKTLN